MRVLVVEDDPKISKFLAQNFAAAGFAVDCCDCGESGLEKGASEHYDVAIVDLMLPGLDGLSMIQQLRARHIQTPVIVLSAKRSVDDRVRCLQRGADDYVSKPFSFSELLARTQAILRRARDTAEPTTLDAGGVVLDRLSREVTRDGKRIELQPREFGLLEQLMRNPDKALSKSHLLHHLWDYSFDPQTNVVDVLVCRLRQKIDKDFDQKLIQTIRGVGYVFRGGGETAKTNGKPVHENRV